MANPSKIYPQEPEENSTQDWEAVPFNPDEFETIELPKTPPSQNSVSVSKPSVNPARPVHQAKEELAQRLLYSVNTEAFAAISGTRTYGFENIVGVGISEKMIGNKFVGSEAVTVYVVSKESQEQISPEALVPKEINGIPTDVIATGEIHALPHKGLYRPVTGGVSVGHYQITAGTVGCLVRRGNALYILSNNHVLANSNAGQIGDPILQPGPYDGGTLPESVVAQLSEFVQIKFDGTANLVDAAIAQADPNLVSPQSRCLGFFNGEPLAGNRWMVVKKCGRSTQFTRGLVTDTNATIRVSYGTAGTAIFQDQIIVLGVPFIAPFSAPGDSGSLVLSEFSNRPVGLLFAGSFTHTIVNKIGNVLSQLNVSIVA